MIYYSIDKEDPKPDVFQAYNREEAETYLLQMYGYDTEEGAQDINKQIMDEGYGFTGFEFYQLPDNWGADAAFLNVDFWEEKDFTGTPVLSIRLTK